MNKPLPPTTLTKSIRWLLALTAAMALAACGGGGGSGGSSATSASASLAASSTLANKCDGGTQEKAFVRSFIHESYLWYRDVPAVNPAAYPTVQSYFSALRTQAKTASGRDVDQFHYSISTAEFNASSAGVELGYGIRWLSQSNDVPRVWMAAHVEAGSPAALAGIRRGDRLTQLDGVDFIYDETRNGIDKINAALFPEGRTTHRLTFENQSKVRQTYQMTATDVDFSTVQGVNTHTLSNGTKVGYFRFDAHLDKSEQELVAAIRQLQRNPMDELVVDLRYNGGGYLRIASKLAYMLAGPAATYGKTFERVIHNDKNTARNWSMPFISVDIDGKPLPSLNLSRVTFLVTGNTASASESLINGLRGVGVQVDLIGDTTRGKPFGFYPQDNCGTTYFAIQFEGVNDKGEGGYVDGFAPVNNRCFARDDLSRDLGSAQETMLKSALWYLETGVCPANALAQMTMRATSQRFNVVRPAVQEMRMLGDIPVR